MLLGQAEIAGGESEHNERSTLVVWGDLNGGLCSIAGNKRSLTRNSVILDDTEKYQSIFNELASILPIYLFVIITELSVVITR